MVNIGALVNPSFAWIKKELCLNKIFAPATGTQCPRTLPFILLSGELLRKHSKQNLLYYTGYLLSGYLTWKLPGQFKYSQEVNLLQGLEIKIL